MRQAEDTVRKARQIQSGMPLAESSWVGLLVGEPFVKLREAL